MPDAQKELRYKISIVADASGATRVIQSLGVEAQKAAMAAGGKAAAAMVQSMAGHAGTPGMSSGGNLLAAATGTNRVTAFDRPIPVIVVGPKSLIEGGVGGGRPGSLPVGGARSEREGVAKTLEILRDLQLGGIVGRAGHIQGYGEALEGMGFARGGKLLGKAALPLAVAGGAIDVARQTATVVHDEFMTGAQRERALFRKVVPFGETIQGTIDDLTGRKQRFEGVEFRSKLAAARVESELARSGFLMQQAPMIGGREGLAEAFAHQKPVLPSVFDRSGIAGQQAFRDEQRLLPYRQAVAKADRELTAAVREREGIEKELGRLSKLELQRRRERAKVEQDLGKEENESGPERQELLRRGENLDREIRGLVEQQKHGRELFGSASEREIQARTESERTRLHERTLGRAEVVAGQAERAEGLASRLGRMGPVERAFGRQALEYVVQNQDKLDFLPRELLQQAGAFAPQTVESIVQKYGAGTAEYREAQRLAPVEFPGGTPGELRQQEDTLRRRAAEQEFKLDTESTRAIAESYRKLGEFLVDFISRMNRELQEQINRNQQLFKNSQN